MNGRRPPQVGVAETVVFQRIWPCKGHDVSFCPGAAGGSAGADEVALIRRLVGVCTWRGASKTRGMRLDSSAGRYGCLSCLLGWGRGVIRGATSALMQTRLVHLIGSTLISRPAHAAGLPEPDILGPHNP